MAILSDGILGAALGKIGPVTGYTRNGRNILRTSRNSGVVVPTVARLAQRQKMTICNEFTRAFNGTGFFNKTFPAYGHTGNGHNRITSCLLHQAVTGNYPAQKLSLEKVLVAKGPLPKAEAADATGEVNGNIHFSWTDNSGVGTAHDTDKVILVAYCAFLNQAVFSLDAGTRNNGHAHLNTSVFKDHEAATWMSFINKDGDVADSVFCGMVQV